MAHVDLPFGSFVPDMPSYKNGGLVRCENVFSIANGYAPIPAPVNTKIGDKALTGRLKGVKRFDVGGKTGILVYATDGVGADSCLCSLLDSNLQETRGLANENSTGDNIHAFTEFEQFNGRIYAINQHTDGGLFIMDAVDAPTRTWEKSWTGMVNDEKDFANPAPPARYMKEMARFLMLANVKDRPTRIVWSPYFNAQGQWASEDYQNRGTQTGYYDYEAKDGEITGLSSGDFNLVFQESAIYRLEYIGLPSVFSSQAISTNRGCAAPRSIVSIGQSVFFLAHDGFCVSNGADVQVLSHGRVWEYFQAQNQPAEFSLVQGVADTHSNSIIWNYTTRAGTKAQLIYNYAFDRWTHSTIQGDWIFEGLPRRITMSDTDPDFPNDDDMSAEGLPSFDDNKFKTQRTRVLSLWVNPATDGGVAEYRQLKGSPLTATFQTGDIQIEAGFLSFIREVMPHIDANEKCIVASITGKITLGGEAKTTDEVMQGEQGFISVINEGRYHSLLIKVPEGVSWRTAWGFSADYEKAGRV